MSERVSQGWTLTFEQCVAIGNVSRGMWCVTDENLNIIYVNRQMEMELGYGTTALKKKSIVSLLFEESTEKLLETYQKLLEGKSGFEHVITTLKTSDGKSIQVEQNIGLLSRPDSEKPVGLTIVMENLTGQRQMELELKEEKERLQTILNSIGVGLLIVDKDQNVFYTNEVITQRFGPIAERKCYSIFQHDKPCEDCVLQRIFTGEDFASIIEYGKDYCGREVALEILASPLRDEDDHLIGVLEIILDVTEKQRLAERVNILAKVVEQMMEGVAITSPEGKIIYINDSLAKLTGWTSDELIGQTADVIYPIASKDTFLDTVFEARKIGETKCLHQNGSEFPILLNSFSIEHDRGIQAAQVWVSMDITERKRLEMDLVQSSKLAALGELISGITHELNNPLTSIMGYAQLLLQKFTDASTFPSLDKVQKNLWSIFNEAERTSKIVSNLLTFARKYKPERKMVDINEVVENTFALRAYELRVNNIQIIKELDERLPNIIADFNQLQQVLLNLINNAAQAMEEIVGDRILKIRTSRQGIMIRIEVIDTGSGISPENIKRIFDPFFTTKGIGVGTGLGLSICFGIVKEHGGRITAESTEGKGSTFIVDLPIKLSTKISDLEDESDSYAVAYTGGMHILVVDDESHIRNILKETMQSQGHHVTVVSDGQRALEATSNTTFDLIITDMKMPQMSGAEFYNILVEKDVDYKKRVVFITGDTMNKETKEFIEKTGCQYLFKPFHLDRLSEVVRKILSETESQTS